MIFLIPPLAWLVFELSPFWFQHNRTEDLSLTEKDGFKVFYSNIFSGNEQKNLLIDYLSSKSPDLAMLVEFDSNWASEVKKLEQAYPYTKAIIKDGNFGMAVLSKHELVLEKVFVDRENLIPALYLKVNHNLHPFRALLVHSFPPIGSHGTLLRDRYLRTLAKVIEEDNGSLIVCGDFNTTPWTSIFKEFMEVSKLKPANEFPLVRTWPTWFFMGLPIDHCLSKNMKISQFKKGPYIGSDHWPLELGLTPNY